MRARCQLLGLFVLLVFTVFTVPGAANGDVEWKVTKKLNLNGPPLDVSESADGKWLFILIPGEILMYSITEDMIKHRVPVDPGYDGLIHSPKTNTLILTSASENKLEVIQLETVHRFDISGLPSKGPNHAPVTLAVFSDYQ